MTRKGKKNISYTQRLILEDCLNAKIKVNTIAEKLGLCRSTVYKEIKRGEYSRKVYQYTDYVGEKRYKSVRAYSANIAQERYRLNASAKGAPIKLGNDYAFADYVENRIINDKLSPAAVLGEIKRKHLFRTEISKTTLYRYISSGVFLNLQLKHLPFAARKKRYRKTVAKRAPRGVSIEKRPAEISERNSFGHWEMDCVLGKKTSKDTLLVLSERLSRYELIFKIPNRQAISVVRALDSIEKRFGKHRFRKIFKSITVDNGVEFSDFDGLERSSFDRAKKRTNVFYCHPYSAYERGTNERINRDIRRLLPKGTDFSKISNKSVHFVESWINSYPRELFNFASSRDIFEHCLAAL